MLPNFLPSVSLLLGFLVGSASARILVDPVTRNFVDAEKRTRIFHGVNIVYKEHPWHPTLDGPFDPDTSLNDEDIANLVKYGFTAVRLGVMWPGVEISPGQYNQTYLDTMVDIVNRLGKAGIYSIVDVHQDLMSRHFCGEGMPEFYVEGQLANKSSTLSKAIKFPRPVSLSAYEDGPDGVPTLEQCQSKTFVDYYFSSRVGKLFKELYTEGSRIQNAFIKMWEKLATTFKDNEYVLGYEIINEPFYGDTARDPLLLWQPHADYVNLQPFYQKVAPAIRAIDEKTPIFFEPTTPLITTPGFTELPIDGDDQLVFSYHIYCTANGTTTFCDPVLKRFERIHMDWVNDHPVGAFLTEFGAIGTLPDELSETGLLLDMADDHLQSWTYWQFKKYKDFTTANPVESFYDGSGKLEMAKLKLLTRTHAQAVAGKPMKMEFDKGTGEFALQYMTSDNSSGNTVVYYNSELWYPKGINVKLDAYDLCAKHVINSFTVEIDASSCTPGTTVDIRLTSK